MIHLKKFTIREDWVPIKLDVAVQMPPILDITHLRGNGPQENENILPETSGVLTNNFINLAVNLMYIFYVYLDAPSPSPFVFDENLMSELTQMGFPPEACKRALFFTKNQGLNESSNWLMEHISDSDFSEPFIPSGAESKSG